MNPEMHSTSPGCNFSGRLTIGRWDTVEALLALSQSILMKHKVNPRTARLLLMIRSDPRVDC